MGGMAAQIPVKNDPAANDAALERVRADKLREVNDGHDGTWVAHPALVAVAREAFASQMTGDNQLDRLREDVHVTAATCCRRPPAPAPKRVFASTFAWACSTSRRGFAATAPCRSTT